MINGHLQHRQNFTGDRFQTRIESFFKPKNRRDRQKFNNTTTLSLVKPDSGKLAATRKGGKTKSFDKRKQPQ